MSLGAGTGADHPPAGAALHLQQSKLLVSAGHRRPTTPPRGSTSPCRRNTTPWRAARRPVPPTRAAGPARQGDRPRKTVHLHLGQAAALSGVRDQPVHRCHDRGSAAAATADGTAAAAAAADRPAWTAVDGASAARSTLVVQANPRQTSRGRGTAERSPRNLRVLRLASSGTSPTRASRWRCRRATCPAGTARRYFAILNQPLPTSAVRLAQRSGELRRLSDVLPRPRARAPVVGTGGRLEELPRAVAERRLRAVLRRDVRREGARHRHLRGRAAPDAPLGDRSLAAGARSISATGWGTSRATAACSAR